MIFINRPSPSLGRYPRLLVVEDDQELLSQVQADLGQLYEVVPVATGQGALNLLSSQPFDLVLLDVILPDITGFQVLERLTELNRSTKVLLMSDLGFGIDSSLLPRQISDLVVKPFRFQELRDRVEQLLTPQESVESAKEPRVKARVLVVDDDTDVLKVMVRMLERAHFQVQSSGSVTGALELLQSETFDVACVDWIMPGQTGIQLAKRIHEMTPATRVIILSGYASYDLVEEATATGVVDVLVKPVSPQTLALAVEKAAQLGRGRYNAASTYETGSKEQGPLAAIVGKSPLLVEARMYLRRAAEMDSTVLLLGETGTGKELFARALHDLSPRRQGPFIAINAAAIPDSLLESELFGYAPGAFTGARKEGQKGRFLQADGGTLFLDEIGDMPLALQAKLLRVLQEGEIDLIGGGTRKVNVRLVAATHQQLEELVAAGQFRSDLYYRLNVVTIRLPPLRDRIGDVSELADLFLEQLRQKYNRPEVHLSSAARSTLMAYHWPGNVRELRNVLERAFAFAGTNLLTPTDIAPALQAPRTAPLRAVDAAAPSVPDVGFERAAIPPEQVQERTRIVKALEMTGGNKVRAAKLLGVSRATLYVKLKWFGLG